MATDYERGKALGVATKKARAEGQNPDIRFDLADEAKTDSNFEEFMRGLNDGIR